MADTKTASKPTNDILAQVVERVKASNNVLVALSNNPSVDEMAAAIGLTLVLDKYQKHATAIFSGKVPNALEFLQPEETFEPNTNSLQDFIIALSKDKADHLRYKIEGDFVKIFITPYRTMISEDDLEYSHGEFNVDLVMALNVATPEDLDKALSEHGRILHNAGAINITAGVPGRLGDMEWTNPATSSVSEMVGMLAEKLDEGKDELLDAQVATAILTGIMAATDRFSNEKTTPETMVIASRLMGKGANQQLISSNISMVANEVAKEEPTEGVVDEEKPVATRRQDASVLNVDRKAAGGLVTSRERAAVSETPGTLETEPQVQPRTLVKEAPPDLVPPMQVPVNVIPRVAAPEVAPVGVLPPVQMPVGATGIEAPVVPPVEVAEEPAPSPVEQVPVNFNFTSEDDESSLEAEQSLEQMMQPPPEGGNLLMDELIQTAGMPQRGLDDGAPKKDYSAMIEQELSMPVGVEAAETPAAGDGAVEAATAEAVATPVAAAAATATAGNLAAQAAPVVATNPEINGVPVINYAQAPMDTPVMMAPMGTAGGAMMGMPPVGVAGMPMAAPGMPMAAPVEAMIPPPMGPVLPMPGDGVLPMPPPPFDPNAGMAPPMYTPQTDPAMMIPSPVPVTAPPVQPGVPVMPEVAPIQPAVPVESGGPLPNQVYPQSFDPGAFQLPS